MPMTASNNYNILFLRATNFYGGPERQIHLHAKLNKTGPYRITIGAFSENGTAPELLKKAQADDIPTHLFAVRNAYDPHGITALRRYIREHRVDLLCTHDYRCTVVGGLAIFDLPTRWIVFSRGWTDEGFKVHAFQQLEKLASRFADHTVAVSRAQADKLIRAGIPGNHITVAYNAVLPEDFTSVPAVDLRARFGFPRDSIVVGSAGRFTREKGQIYLARAAVEALRIQPRLRFLMFGDGPERSSILRFIKSSGCESEIVLPGFEKNVIAHLKGLDLLVNPSLSEGLPNIVLEAVALGIPVLATAVGGVPELVEDKISGLLAAPSDISSLTHGIIQLASMSQSRRLEMIDNGRQAIQTRFSFNEQNRMLREVYNKMLQKETPP
jgi:glycosyltransferase involved in cell wall biosynthesis